ncbi:MAG TPA: S8 family serine peptidase, partial [Miltoncostaeaceae bacterium]|nr:S8 family serine peptidase [Miltoncostaeaceae bacterium]
HHIALIDTGIDPRTPQIGGGIGPTFPVIGGRDLVDGDADPTVGESAPAWEAHGTQMAGLVLTSPALDGLPPERVPRLLAYRVVGEEEVGGRRVPLARSDRVVSALEAAVDPDGDGDTRDGAEVVLLGLASGFAGGGRDPVAAAVAGAGRAGALVVAPAGNDGPTFARLGSLGDPAAAPDVLTVGGLAEERAPRTASLRVSVGPAGALLGHLPLLGPAPLPAEAPLVALPGPDGPGTGATSAEWDAAQRAVPALRGAVVVVRRGGGPVGDLAARAAAAGAIALVVWDRDGSALFPSGAADGGPVIPVAGMGAEEGEALVALLAGQDRPRAILREEPRATAPVAVASFSSTGPTADGRVKPDLVAPAVNVPAPWPPGPDGGARTAPMTGTSAAAAQTAAVALRLRLERPDLGPEVVHSLMVASARPLDRVRLAAGGAGALAPPAPAAAVVLPSAVTAAAGPAPVARFRVHDLSGRAARYRVHVLSADRRTALGAPVAVTVPAGGRARVAVRLPGGRDGWSGRVEVRDAAGAPVAHAQAATYGARPHRPADLGAPRVRTRGGTTEATVRIGRRMRLGDRIWSAPLHGVRLELLPADGSAPLPVAGLGGRHDWPAGEYRFVLSRRLPTGGTVPAGEYALRVRARTADGRALTRTSARFRLG